MPASGCAELLNGGYIRNIDAFADIGRAGGPVYANDLPLVPRDHKRVSRALILGGAEEANLHALVAGLFSFGQRRLQLLPATAANRCLGRPSEPPEAALIRRIISKSCRSSL